MAQRKQLRSTSVALSASWEAVNDYFYTHGYTDGLPVVPPTEDRVQAMIEASGRDGEEVIARLAPTLGEATVEKIAINAVMAGCEPPYIPLLLAAVKAMAQERFNLQAVQATTNPATPMLIINGPVRRQLDINCSSNALGQGWKANATIGRAVRLMLVNIGGGAPGLVDKATQGMPGKYTFCFGENEEESPWSPLHVERGFKPDMSAVTVVAAQGTHNIIDVATNPRDLAHTLTLGTLNIGVNNFHFPGGETVLLLCPSHARILVEGGYTRETLKEHFFQHARAPLEWFSEGNRRALTKRGAILDGKVPLVVRPDLMIILVVGGPGGLHSTFVPTFGGFSLSVTEPVTTP